VPCHGLLRFARNDGDRPQHTTRPLAQHPAILRPHSSPPATPKLTRHLAWRTASRTSAAVRPGSPAPTMTWKPAALAILASAASPEVQSTGANVRIRSPPLRCDDLRRGEHDRRRNPRPIPGTPRSKRLYSSGVSDLPARPPLNAYATGLANTSKKRTQFGNLPASVAARCRLDA